MNTQRIHLVCVAVLLVAVGVQGYISHRDFHHQDDELRLLREQVDQQAKTTASLERTLSAELQALTSAQAKNTASFEEKLSTELQGLTTAQAKNAANLEQKFGSELQASIAVQAKNTASVEQKFSSGLQALTAAVDRGFNNQTAVLDRAFGKYIPIQLPDGLAKSLADVEATVDDPAKWPKSSGEARNLQGRLSDLTRQIPPWAEEDLLPRLNRLRWSAQGFSLLLPDSTNAVTKPASSADDLSSLLTAKPDGAPNGLQKRLEEALEAARQKEKALRLASAKDSAAVALKHGGKDALLAAWRSVQDFDEDDAELKTLKDKLRLAILEDDAATLKKRLTQVGSLADEQLRQAGIMQVYQAAVTQRLNLKLEGDPPGSVDQQLFAIIQDGEGLLKKAAQRQQEDQAAKVRAYQQWALAHIHSFNDQYSQIQAEVDSKRTWKNPLPQWEDQHYKRLTEAAITHLLPVNAALLEQPVGMLYSEAYDKGWKKMGDEDKLYVAKRTVDIVKATPDSAK